MSSTHFEEMSISARLDLAVRYNNSGHKKYLQVDFDDAMADYTQAVNLNPHLAVAFYNRGTVLYRIGEFEKAVSDLEKAVQLDPNNPEFQEGLRESQRLCNEEKRDTRG